MRHAGFARNFDSTLRRLAERGHAVHVAFDVPFAHARLGAGPGIVERLAAEHPSVTLGPAPDRSGEGSTRLGLRLRLGIDYLRFLDPAYGSAPKLRARAEAQAGPALRALGRVAARRPSGPAALSRALRALEASLPVSPRAWRFVREQRPDVVLVTPLVELGEPQTDFVRAAKALGIPSGLCVASWDNLTNKGVVSETPDLVAVWNEAQREEAVALHGVPRERVVATGAHSYDHWFDWAPSRDRYEFARTVGLPTEGPLLLYLCSSEFIAPDEAGFVRRWLRDLRARPEPELRDAAVLVRPHPQHAEQWRGVDLSYLGPVSVWPPAGADPTDADSRRDYFDSLYHCSAVVGVNTSALIESAIVGRPVLTYLAPEFRETQRGTPHFAHLADGGLLRVADSFEQHAVELASALSSGEGAPPEARAFVRSFLRPHGLEQAAAPRLVDALERLACTPAQPLRAPALAPITRLALAPLAALAGLDARLRRVARAGARRALAVPAVRRRVLGWVEPPRRLSQAPVTRHLRSLVREPAAPALGAGREP